MFDDHKKKGATRRMSDKKVSKEYEGMYCPFRQSNIQALKCLEEYCMFYRKESLVQNASCWIKDGFVGLARTWEIRE